MKKHLMKHLIAPLAFAAIFLLFGTPSAPGTAILPTVGGDALAYRHPQVLPDADGDGIMDVEDECPYDASNTCNDNDVNSKLNCNTLANAPLAVGSYSVIVAVTSFFLPPPLNLAGGIVSAAGGGVSVGLGFAAAVCYAGQ